MDLSVVGLLATVLGLLVGGIALAMAAPLIGQAWTRRQARRRKPPHVPPTRHHQ